MLNMVKYFFQHLFRFRPPQIQELHYIDYIISNKSYFLISWKTRFAYKLSINSFYSINYRGSGSIYTLLPDGIENLEIVFSNLWFNKRINIQLKHVEVDIPFEFELSSNFKEWRSVNIHLLKPNIPKAPPQVNCPQPKFQISKISVQNLSFPKI